MTMQRILAASCGLALIAFLVACARDPRPIDPAPVCPPKLTKKYDRDQQRGAAVELRDMKSAGKYPIVLGMIVDLWGARDQARAAGCKFER